MKIHIGCCGWGRLRPAIVGAGPDWKDHYPHKLSLYASAFDIVEVNSTFYRLPRPRTAKRWLDLARAVNPNFEFTVKVWREITHLDRFRTDHSLAAYTRTVEIADALHAGILLFQTPASFHPTDENTTRLRKFFRKIGRHGRKIAFELRGWDEKSVQAVNDLDLIPVTDPFARTPTSPGPAYLRLHGAPPGKRMYRYNYTDPDLHWLAQKITSLPADEAYIMFNNDHMYENALSYWRQNKTQIK
jgi:uncharacterized protein YecE (DUF72 family)